MLLIWKVLKTDRKTKEQILVIDSLSMEIIGLDS